ncbi:PhzF family phenazine biosynthesis protein [Pedococcus sp. KACC 23699]|uniref:PhzF family phenazine biosynthesis protein n=1 Tax=Pedococcus sp. KACC 23699 TaxID=3149228 RepID=A0AAU7JSL6_9MICO
MRLTYRLLNVFARTGEPFSGNPLCVVLQAQDLSDEQMQGVARQFNLSETTFLVPAADGADAGVRIFTPNYEMAFAGHPTLGTAHAVRALGLAGDSLRLSMPAGTIPVTADGDTWTLTARPGVVQADYKVDEIASCVGLAAEDLIGPVQQVSTGSAQVIARATSVEAVRRAVGDAALMRQFAGMGTRGGETLVYLWCETGEGEIEARALFTQGAAAIEDPATGSACSNLGAWLADKGRSGTWVVSQGAQVGRPSTLLLDVDDEGTVEVGGLVRELGEGVIEL